MTKRRRFTAEFKARVALDALRFPGESFSRTFNEPGAFSYRCENHFDQGTHLVLVE